MASDRRIRLMRTGRPDRLRGSCCHGSYRSRPCRVGRYSALGGRTGDDRFSRSPRVRGGIYDRNGGVLAITVPRSAVVADPFIIKTTHRRRRRCSLPSSDVPQATLLVGHDREVRVRLPREARRQPGRDRGLEASIFQG